MTKCVLKGSMERERTFPSQKYLVNRVGRGRGQDRGGSERQTNKEEQKAVRLGRGALHSPESLFELRHFALMLRKCDHAVPVVGVAHQAVKGMQRRRRDTEC